MNEKYPTSLDKSILLYLGPRAVIQNITLHYIMDKSLIHCNLLKKNKHFKHVFIRCFSLEILENNLNFVTYLTITFK